MVVYYISESSSLMRPADIQHSGLRIVKRGDICIRANCNGISALLIKEIDANWPQCHTIAYSKNKLTHDPGNTLLFSYDGINRRSGNIAILSELVINFDKDTDISEFLENAIDILKHKEDSFDFGIISKIYNITSIASDKPIDSNKTDSHEEYYTTPLSPFLPDKIKNTLSELLKSGLPLYECYCKLKNTYTIEFIMACKKYATAYPGRSIY